MSDLILVIGATGNVGHALVELLTARGEAVRAATRRPDAYDGPAGAMPAHFDLDEPATWEAALQGVNRVFVIPKNSDPTPETTLVPFLQQAEAMGVEHAVLMTAVGVDQTERGLREVELHLIEAPLAHTILRPNWFMQNFAPGFMRDMLREGTLYLPAADGRSSLIDTRDIAAVAAKALTEDGHAGQEYTLTGPEAFSYAEALAVLSEVAGRGLTYVPIPDEAFRSALAEEGWGPEQIDLMSYLFHTVRQNWTAPVAPDVAEVLGRPATTLSRYAEDHADAWT